MRLIKAEDVCEMLAIIADSKAITTKKGAIDIAKTALDDIPTIDPESLRPKWIPVTERLPEVESTHSIYRGDKYTKSIRVLCACEQANGKKMVKEGYCEIWNDNVSNPHWKIPGTIDFVTHWMPLPEPPKVGDPR